MTVRALVIDDSPTMRGVVTALLRRDPEVEVIGTAATPVEARSMIRELDPDVVTLDVEMPGMDGLAFLEKIMRLRPTPVVMVSSHTTAGAEATVRALELGAIDCYAKPSGGLGVMRDLDDGELAAMVKLAAGCRDRLQHPRRAVRSAERFRWNGRIAAIAASTGGVEALGALLAGYPDNGPPTIVVQHMPAGFTRMFASRLDARVAPRVVEAAEGMPVEQGHVYIAPGGTRHLTVSGRKQLVCRLTEGAHVSGHRPSADAMFRSLAGLPADKVVGAILTGMGEDGAEGLAALRKLGMPTIGQDEASALIYGMPRAAAERGALAEILPVDRIAARILELCRC
ncbi:chemotaxis response regulator protein-glutamate methylesterase [uncultured Sphingomonas sp.]|uniref:protein-glutamate methylesterase/protein-glutamine glutaminase n=1 Tax=uncultured Sphingomonas sp. TaxID=158754 RepID=UPI0025F85BB4|nr:chemotaxis response regulator protein-glutamate methylesterase [uncultured Sphingomonas sp.]